MRILRGLDSRALDCGCLVGVYETYGAKTIAVIDAKGSDCADDSHRVDSPIDIRQVQLPPDGTTDDKQQRAKV